MKKKIVLKAVSYLLVFAMVSTTLTGNNGEFVSAAKKASLDSTSFTLQVGNQKTIKITNKKKKAVYTFSSSKSKVAAVNKKGKVTAKKAGKATVTVKEKLSGKKAKVMGKVKITVKSKPTVTATPVATAAAQTTAPTMAPKATPTVAPTITPAATPIATASPASTAQPVNEKFCELVSSTMQGYSADEKGLVFDNTSGTCWTKQYQNLVNLPIPANLEMGFTSIVYDISCYDANGNEIKYTDDQKYSGPVSSYVVATSKNIPEGSTYASDKSYYTEALWNFVLNGVSILTLGDAVTADYTDGTGFVPIEIKDNETVKKIVIHSVRFSGYPGYDLPKPTSHSETGEDVKTPADVDVSSFYSDMVSKSLVSTGNNARIKKAIDKAKNGDDVTIAYIGGSITEGEGASPNSKDYVEQSYQAFKTKYGKDGGSNVHFVNAGMSGTPSSLGKIRYQRDILDQAYSNPDILFIEFAVNDSGECTGGEAYESMIRDAMNSGSAVVLMFSVFKSKWNMQSTYQPIGTYYDLPMISMKDAIVPYWTNDIKYWYFNDELHPNNYGYGLMSDCIMNLYSKIDEETADSDTYDMTKTVPFKGDSYSGLKMLDSSVDMSSLPEGITSLDVGGFSEKDSKTGTFYYKDKNGNDREKFPDNWMHTATSGAISFNTTVNCSNLMIVYKLSSSTDFGTAEVLVDGNVLDTMNGYNTDGWNNATTELVFKDTKVAQHKVEIRMAAGFEDKCFTVLALGYNPTVSAFAGQSSEPTVDVDGTDMAGADNVAVSSSNVKTCWSTTVSDYTGPNSTGVKMDMSGQYGQANITFPQDIDISQYSKIVLKCKATEGTYAVKLLGVNDKDGDQGITTSWGVADTVTIDVADLTGSLNRIGICSTNDGTASMIITKVCFVK